MKSVMILTPVFSPNIGGVETHLDDLVAALDRRGYDVYVLTYSPITSPGVRWQFKEKWGRNITIYRFGWIGKNLFHKLERYPLLDFLYLSPYLGMMSFFFLLFHFKMVDVIHAQGLNAAFIGSVLKKVFRKKLVVSTHAVYEIGKNSRTTSRIKNILGSADNILCLSRASLEELASFSIGPEKLHLYSYWLNLDSFRPAQEPSAGFPLDSTRTFSVLFVGRLIKKKGTGILLEVAKSLPYIQFVFIGIGPEGPMLKEMSQRYKNVVFVGKVPNKELPEYYNRADIFCIPSQYEEGFGRVVMEAVACGVPVVGSNKGGIPEALDDSVSILTDPTVENLTRAIHQLYHDQDAYQRLKENCRAYALDHFQEENASQIARHY